MRVRADVRRPPWSQKAQAEDAIYDCELMRRFAGVELSEDVVPDETTILRFRHLLEEHHLTEAIFAAVRALLTEKRLRATSVA